MTSPTSKTPLRLLVFRWTSVGILVMTAAFIMQIERSGGSAGLKDLGSLALLSLALVGKFVVFSGLHADTPSVWVLAIMVFLLDLLWALVLLNGLGSLERAPMLGGWLRKMRGRAKLMIEEYPGLQRMAFIGVFTFVMLPIAATGAITGALASRLLGLTRIEGLIAIASGSAFTATTFALLAQVLGERAEDMARSPFLVAGILIFAFLAGRSAYARVMSELKRK